MTTNKTCTKCGVEKELGAFRKNSKTTDNRRNDCEECCRARKREWHKSNKEAVREYSQERRKTPKGRVAHRLENAKHSKTPLGKATKNRATIKHREKHPQKYKAHKTITAAIQSGKLIKGLCEHNGPSCLGHIEAHHDDYTKPLEVRWLCLGHHKELHHQHYRETGD